MTLGNLTNTDITRVATGDDDKDTDLMPQG